MPFQISLSNGAHPLGVIATFDAGVDQYATCAPSVTLTATVVGNLGGHQISWEQVTGDTQIIWVTPTNQLTVTYTVIGGGSSDRVFRFYVDKGTPIQQYSDITVWGTPTETQAYAVSSLTVLQSIEQSCKSIPCSSVSVFYGFPPPSAAGTVAVNPSTGFYMTWSAPTCLSISGTDTSYVSVIQNNNGQNTVLGAFMLPTVNVIPIPTPYDIYYLTTTYTQGSNIYHQTPCRYGQVQPSNVTNIYATDTALSPNVIPKSQATYYSLTILTDPVSTNATVASVTVSSSAVYYSLVALPDPMSTQTTILSTINTNRVVQYYSNNGIGG